jgi:hypothetical protein
MTSELITFRRAETQRVLDCWRRPVSCAVVGVGSVGKTNFYQHLAHPSIASLAAGIVKRPVKVIALDPNLLAPLPPLQHADRASAPGGLMSAPALAIARRYWAGCELVFTRLVEAFAPYPMLSAEDAQAVDDLYAAFRSGDNPLYLYLGLRYLELALDHLFQSDTQIVFLLDDFEHMLERLPVQFFLGLRGLRDAYKTQLSFVAFSRAPLGDVVAAAGLDPVAIEPFIELFNDDVIALAPYREMDARAALTTVMARKAKQYSAVQQDLILWASGGHAGLLRACAGVFDGLGRIASEIPAQGDRLVQALLARSVVRAECAVIWRGLNTAQRAMLRGLAAGERISLGDEAIRTTFDQLVHYGFVQPGEGGAIGVVPPVFAAYVASDRAEQPARAE